MRIMLFILWCGLMPLFAQVEWNLVNETSTRCDLQAVTQGDFNGDGNLDVVVLGYKNQGTNVCFEMLAGDGKGDLSDPILTDFGGFDPSLIGRMRVLNLPRAGADHLFLMEKYALTVYQNQNDGTFAKAATFEAPNSANYIDWVVTDLTGDGTREIVVGHNDPAGFQVLHWADGTLRLTSALAFHGGSDRLHDIATGDFNGDGTQDIILYMGDEISVYPVGPDGQPGPRILIPATGLSFNGTSITAGDFNGDGLADLALPSGGAAVIMYSNGAGIGEVTEWVDENLHISGVVGSGDFDHDGDIDLLLNVPVAWSMAWNQGNDVEFEWLVRFDSPLLFDDFNGDGRTDLVSIDRNGLVQLALASGTTDPTVTPSVPTFVTSSNFWWSDSGVLECLFPDPASDGAVGDLGYEIWLESSCETIGEPVLITGVAWPYILSTPNLGSDIVIRIVRVLLENGVVRERSDTWTVTPPPWQPVAEQALTRWLLHVPRPVGGFNGLLRVRNGHPALPASVSFSAYDASGSLVTTSQLDVGPLQTVYRPLYGSDGLFSGFDNQVSHVGISDDVGNQSAASLQIIGEVSGFGSWVREVNIGDGLTTGPRFTIEPRSNEAYADGLAVLNLARETAVEVWAVQLTREGEALQEVKLGTVAPMGKLLSVVSGEFPYVAGSVYRLETRAGNHPIQLLGMTFYEDSFFAPVAVQLD